MKAKFGALVTSGSGKLGGHMFSQTPNGVIMKTTGSYSKKASAIQTIKRINTKILMALWSQISFEQRTLWESAAHDYRRIDVFSEVRTFNGFQLFQKINQNRVQLGMAPMLNPAPAHLPTFPTPVSVTVTASSLILLSTAYNFDDIILIYATSSLGNGITSVKKRMRFIVAVTSAELASGLNIIANYLQIFPPPVNGNNIHIGVKTVSAISYFSNKLLYSSSGYVSSVITLTPVFRLRSRPTAYIPTDGSLIWFGGTSGTGWNLTGSSEWTSVPDNYLTLPAYISPADYNGIFQAQRYGNMVLTGLIPNGNYLIRYYDASTDPADFVIGKNVVVISVNGIVKVPAYDAYGLYGAENLGYLEFEVQVTTNSLSLTMTPSAGLATFRAIEVLSIT